jgi:hypothetical protein
MLKVNACPICGQPMQDEQPSFYFPKLPDWHSLSAYYGTVHIECLQAPQNREEVSKTLADIYESFYGERSATPVVARENNVVIKDCRNDSACFEVYDFDDFAEFSIPIHALKAVQQLKPNHCLSLGVHGLQVLHRAVDGT